MIGIGTSGAFSPGLALGTARAGVARADERLATGLRINRGSDDPAGLIASESLGARITQLDARIAASERSAAVADARDGALASIGVMAGDLGAMVVRAANAGGSGEAGALASGIAGIVSAIDSAAGSARFNGSALLGGFDAATLGRTQIGTDPDTGDAVYASVADLERLSADNPEAAQAVARRAVSDIAFARAADGARQRGAESERRAAETERINAADARSAIRDADYAKETRERVRAGLMERVNIRTALIGRRATADSVGRLLGTRVDVIG